MSIDDVDAIVLGGSRVDSVGSGLGPVVGSCEYSDEPSGSGTIVFCLGGNSIDSCSSQHKGS
jgi:hypothetical protein